MLNLVKLKPSPPIKAQNKPSMTNFYHFKVVQKSSAIPEDMSSRARNRAAASTSKAQQTYALAIVSFLIIQNKEIRHILKRCIVLVQDTSNYNSQHSGFNWKNVKKKNVNKFKLYIPPETGGEN